MNGQEDAPIPEEMIPKGATYQGKPCPHGHPGVRFIRGGACIHCSRKHNDNYTTRTGAGKWRWSPEKKKPKAA